MNNPGLDDSRNPLKENLVRTKRREAARQDRELVISIRGDDKKLVAREQPSHRLLARLKEETWFRGLRKGHLGPDPRAVAMTILSPEGEDPSRLSTFLIELEDATGSYRHRFSTGTLSAPAHRLLSKLREGGVLAEGAEVSIDVSLAPAAKCAPRKSTSRGVPVGGRIVTTSMLPSFEKARLDDYLTRSDRLTGGFGHLEEDDLANDDSCPLFVTRGVWGDSRLMARRGGEQESAAMWTGRLMQDSSGEIFIVIDSCMPAEKAIETQFSVAFSGETWAQLQERLEKRRQRLRRPSERFCASVHGHNFGPSTDDSGNAMCAACATAKVCGRTTASASTDDESWHRAVFGGQPWAVLLVYGWNARQEEDWRLYGLRDGGLHPRPLYLLQD